MSEPISTETQSPEADSRVITIWTPKNIFWLGIFLGWPTALVLCIINWFRMGLWKKAIIFSGGGLVTLILFFGASFRLSENSNTLPFLAFNILLLVSFQSLMKIDITSSGNPNTSYRQAGIGWGILIGLLTLAVILGSGVIIFVFVELVKTVLLPF